MNRQIDRWNKKNLVHVAVSINIRIKPLMLITINRILSSNYLQCIIASPD